MSNSLKYKLAKYIQDRKLSKTNRNKQFLSFDKIQQIGILFDLYDEDRFDKIKKIVHYLTDKHKEVISLGYFPGKELANRYLLLQRFKFFTKKDINFIGIPNKPVVGYFIKKPYDLLIDFTTKKSFCTNYILTLCNAKMKAGYYVEGNEVLDFMIKNEDNSDIDFLFDQIKYYLTELKTNNIDSYGS